MADKSGGVWEPTDGLGELGVGLESDDFLLHRGRSVAGFGADGNTGWRRAVQQAQIVEIWSYIEYQSRLIPITFW
ncbi:MAG: hypothetical protein SFT91_06330 [Rickettsiaceae bacterium]|nr:hypothetical protein [Rickettsiaceae bacterium]